MLEKEAKELLAAAEALRVSRARLEVERAQSVGAIKNAVSELKTDYGVSSLEEAHELLESMQVAVSESVRHLREKLKEIDGEEDNSREA
jgi:hypothetical protein